MKRIHNINKIISPFILYHPTIYPIPGNKFNTVFHIKLVSGQYLRVCIQFSREDRDPCCIISKMLGNASSNLFQYNMEETIQYLREVSEVKDTGLSALEYRNSLLKHLDNPRKWRRLFDQLTDTDIMYSELINTRTVKFLLSGDEVSLLLDNENWSIYQRKTNFGYKIVTRNVYKIKHRITV